MSDDVFVSVVAPLQDTAESLDAFVAEVVQVLRGNFRYYEVLLIDDGSRNIAASTWSELLGKHEGVRVLHLSRRFGEEQAIAAGLENAIGDFVVTMSVGADPPKLIPDLVNRARDGADVVLGVRTSRKGDPWWLRAGTGAFHWYSRRVLHLDVPVNATHFRCLSRAALNSLNKLRETGSRLRVFSSYIGYSSATFRYEPLRRGKPRTSREAIGLALALVLDNSAHPLRLVSTLGVISAVLNLAYAGYVVVVYTLREDVAAGWATISLTSAMQFFFLSVMLAVLGEYVGRLPKRFGSEPGYYVRAEQTSAVLLREDRKNVITGT